MTNSSGEGWWEGFPTSDEVAAIVVQSGGHPIAAYFDWQEDVDRFKDWLDEL